ncbi:MAG: hypothetical protein RR292_07945, partial [Christensenellaceae bacterium]
MDDITQELISHGKSLAKHESDIKTLFNQQKNITTLAESTQTLALSVEKLAGKVDSVDDRLICIE